MALRKQEIVMDIYGVMRHWHSKKECHDMVETLVELVKQSLEDGEDVLISGFGKFCVKEKGVRRGRNPATGEDMTLRPRRVVTFKCSGKLRDKFNGKEKGWWQK